MNDKKMIIEEVEISALVPDPANMRTHGEKNLESIKGSLKRFGQQKPIVVGKDGVVIAGNGTLAAARSLGWKVIRIVRTDLEGTDRTAFAIADNRTAELAEWSDDLAETLGALDLAGFDISDIGFDAEDMTPKDKADKAAGEALLDQAIQLQPQREYCVITCANDEEWEAMKAALRLAPVRRGGYKKGSPFDAVGTQRVVPWSKVAEIMGGGI